MIAELRDCVILVTSSTTGPLSLEKMTSVLRTSPLRSSAPSTCPTVQSNSAMASPRGPIGVLPPKRLFGRRGTWISCVAKYRKNGRALFCAMNAVAFFANVSAMSSSTHRADFPPVM